MIWDLSRIISVSDNSESENAPIRQYVVNEAVQSVSYAKDDPNMLVAGVGQRYVRMYDLRDPTSPSIASTISSRACVYGLHFSPTDYNLFASYSEDGIVAIWDRRFLKPAESTLYLASPFSTDEGQPTIVDLRFSSSSRGKLVALNSGGKIVTWQVSSSANYKNSTFKQRMESITPPELIRTEQTVIESMSKASSFDLFSNHNLIKGTYCVYQIDDKPVLSARLPSPSYVDFNSRNELAISREENLIFSKPSSMGNERRQSESIEDDVSISETDNKTELELNRPSSPRLGNIQHRNSSNNMAVIPLIRQRTYSTIYFKLNASNVLYDDISIVMRMRALAGYEMDSSKNIGIVKENPFLQLAWIWIEGASKMAEGSKMRVNSADLSFQGADGIWNARTDIPVVQAKDSRRNKPPSSSSILTAISTVISRLSIQSFTSAPTKTSQRVLALAMSGWDFSLNDLEAKLKSFEKQGQIAKAAAWALFHGDVERCVESLSRGTERMKLMSTAVAGYAANQKLQNNVVSNQWRKLCNDLSVELDQPYLRAIFGYVGSGDWQDVLDEQALPLEERLGIALRFLSENDLTSYLNSLKTSAIASGDIEGIMLTGIRPAAIDLLQNYVDKTSDFQSAALISLYAVPSLFHDDRVRVWVEAYRNFLNSSKLFHERAKFDIALRKHAGSMFGSLHLNPKRLYVRCNNCNQSITRHSIMPEAFEKSTQIKRDNQRTVNISNNSTACPNCKRPLPRCAVCLLWLGIPVVGSEKAEKKAEKKVTGDINSISSIDNWFTFCMTCSHGFHVKHAKQWFASHSICPVPDCSCNRCCE